MGEHFTGTGLSYPDAVEVDKSYTDRTGLEISVVVVTYQTQKTEFERMLSGLDEQTDEEFETVIVDNGNDWAVESVVADSPVVDRYVALDRNRGVTVGRNVGADRTTGDILVFLDDDAVPDAEFIAAHRRAYDRLDIVAARGKVLPKTASIYNNLAIWYDLGDETFPFLLNIEGNTSIDSDAFKRVGGFIDLLDGRAGHEGVELTHRLVESGYDRNQIVYYPDAIIYHDQSTSFWKFVQKKVGNEQSNRLLKANHIDVHEFAQTYETPNGHGRRLRGLPQVIDLGTDAIVRLVLRIHPT